MTLPRESLVHMNRGFYRYNIEPVVINGYFTCGAGATFYVTQIGGQGCEVTRTGVGDYLITLDDTDIVDVISATAWTQCEAAAATDLIARCESVTAGPPTTIVVESYAAAVATDVLDGADEKCHFQIVYTRSWRGQPLTKPLGYYHHDSDPVIVCGRVEIDAAGAVGAHHGAGYTMTKVGGAGTGTYLLTFDDAFNAWHGGIVNAGNGSGIGGDISANFGAFAAGGAGAATLTIYTNTGAGAADPAATGQIDFFVYLHSEGTGA